MTEIRRLTPLGWLPTDPLVAYNNADGSIVPAAAMSRGNNSYYDRHGFHGSRQIVCVDCKEDVRDAPLSLVKSTARRPHLRHQPGEAPDGLRRHGETAEHLRGKALISSWARDQRHIFPWSIEEEVWVTGARLRSDVRAEITGGGHLAFEVQRKPVAWSDWDRRHCGYGNEGIRDLWLWAPEVPDPVLDLPLVSVVLDLQHEELGVLVASYAGRYRHPTNEDYLLTPTHYAAAPLGEWSISDAGKLVPPADLNEFIGVKPEAARRVQLQARRERLAPPSPPLERPQLPFVYKGTGAFCFT